MPGAKDWAEVGIRSQTYTYTAECMDCPETFKHPSSIQRDYWSKIHGRNNNHVVRLGQIKNEMGPITPPWRNDV